MTTSTSSINRSPNFLTPEEVDPQDPITRSLGQKQYELSNHLGNVLVTVSDRKLAEGTEGTTATGYKADVLFASDYYLFGMQMPGREFSAEEYRYGFQGQETDKEWLGGAVSYKYRVHDARIGRFLSVDPLTKKYPHYSPYSFSGNKVIAFTELEGLEEIHFAEGLDKGLWAAFQLYSASDVGVELIASFTDPAINDGWDIVFFSDSDGLIGDPNGGTVFLDFYNTRGDGKDKLELKYQNEVNDIKSNPSKKGVIFIGFPSSKILEQNERASDGEWHGVDDPYLEATSEGAHTIAHELRAHTVPFLLGNSQNQKIEHYNYHYDPEIRRSFGFQDFSPSMWTVAESYPQSLGGLDAIDIMNTATSFNDQGRTFMRPIETKGPSQISNQGGEKSLKI